MSMQQDTETDATAANALETARSDSATMAKRKPEGKAKGSEREHSSSDGVEENDASILSSLISCGGGTAFMCTGNVSFHCFYISYFDA